MLGLSQDTVGLFLEEAIALGYCERDMYDKQCYYSISEPNTLLKEALRKNPSLGTLEEKTIDEEVKEKQQQKQEKSVTLTKPIHGLPPSPKVKTKMLDTLLGYIEECQPKTFTPSDVLNYVYSDEQQNQWTETQATKIFKAIAKALHYYWKQKKWQRVRVGVYRT